MTARRRVLILFALPVAAAVAGCSATGGLAGGSGRASGRQPAVARPSDDAWRLAANRGGYPATFVASVSGTGGPANRGLAVFSAADGHLIRWLAHNGNDLVPVAVSPDGRWVYFNQGASAPGKCPRTGFTEPVLWRVRASGGRPQRAGIRTTSLAFSPDGRMVAYTVTRRCGATAWIVVRDRRAATSRRILLARNPPTSNNPIFLAQLSWAPDDTRLAVAVMPAAAINVLSLINARHAASLPVTAIRPCNSQGDGCLDPRFDIRGRLTFLKWRDQASRLAEWVDRWRHRRATRLFLLSPKQSDIGGASIAVDRTGNVILVEGGLRQHEIWRWSGGRLRPIVRSSRRQIVT